MPVPYEVLDYITIEVSEVLIDDEVESLDTTLNVVTWIFNVVVYDLRFSHYTPPLIV